MSFKVESDNLRHQASIWHGAKNDADSVKQSLSGTVGQGEAFGFMAGSMGVSGRYDEWTSDMDNALSDASYSFAYLDAALTSTANGYDDSDATAATGMAELDRKLDEGSYHHD
jgi:hypothetical protein